MGKGERRERKKREGEGRGMDWVVAVVSPLVAALAAGGRRGRTLAVSGVSPHGSPRSDTIQRRGITGPTFPGCPETYQQQFQQSGQAQMHSFHLFGTSMLIASSILLKVVPGFRLSTTMERQYLMESFVLGSY
ncbi:hypothetical protein E2562_002951 [Oryza meyeriana var. granulata]|uniref:Uncharacterized protein n=1 Tax=Oryza meyeriana var. granulata TaxID=110450 RepID=A0A6G1DDI1_9ORYZ|nr:hypothetical protein E2562_002951 [Oryza meyeriana var. granulata]